MGDKCTAISSSIDAIKDNKDTIRIFNFSFHDKITNMTLFCVAEKQDMNVNAARGYKWKMISKLYTAKDLENEFGIKEDKLPKSFHETEKFKTYSMDKSQIENVLKNKEKRQKLIDSTAWHKVDIFNKINNKRRMTLSLTKPEFMKQCTEFVNKQ